MVLKKTGVLKRKPIVLKRGELVNVLKRIKEIKPPEFIHFDDLSKRFVDENFSVLERKKLFEELGGKLFRKNYFAKDFVFVLKKYSEEKFFDRKNFYKCALFRVEKKGEQLFVSIKPVYHEITSGRIYPSKSDSFSDLLSVLENGFEKYSSYHNIHLSKPYLNLAQQSEKNMTRGDRYGLEFLTTFNAYEEINPEINKGVLSQAFIEKVPPEKIKKIIIKINAISDLEKNRKQKFYEKKLEKFIRKGIKLEFI